MKRDLNELASRINLEDFAKSVFGYKTDHEKTSKRWPALFNEGDKIIIGNGKDGEFYYNVNNPSDKGNAIKFAFNRSSSWKEAFERIDNYLNEPNNISLDSRIQQFSDDRVIASNRDFQVSEFTHRKYLYDRGITDETIDNPTFKGSVFNKIFDLKIYTHKLIEEKFKDVHAITFQSRALELAEAKNYSGDFISTLKGFNHEQSDFTDLEKIEKLAHTKVHFDQSDDRKIVNTVFPLKNENDTIGLIVRNRNRMEIVGFRDMGLWSSAYMDAPTSIYISESPIDCLSHYQLHKPANSVYFATGGSPSNNQLNMIQHKINALKPVQVVLANDHDFGGMKSNIQILDKLVGTKTNFEIGLVTHDKQSAMVLLKSPSIAELVVRFELTLLVGEDAQVTQARITSDTTAEIQFPYKISLFKKIEEFLIREKGLGNLVHIHRPIGKDFNDDLQNLASYK